MDDMSAFMASSGARVWRLLAGSVGEEPVRVQKARLGLDSLRRSDSSASDQSDNKDDNTDQSAEDDDPHLSPQHRIELYDQWLIVQAPLLVWVVFVLVLMSTLGCAWRCMCGCCCT